MSKLENRDQLIGLLSTTSGYADRHPTAAEEILDALEAAGCTVVPNEATEEMEDAWWVAHDAIGEFWGQFVAGDTINAANAASPYRRKP